MPTGHVILKLLGAVLLSCIGCSRSTGFDEAGASFRAAMPQGAFAGDSDSARMSFAKTHKHRMWFAELVGEEALRPVEGDSITYRFHWLRSFDHPMVFTLMVGKDSRVLVWKELSGQRGYDWGKVSCSGRVELLPSEFGRFVDLLKRCDFYDMAASDQEEDWMVRHGFLSPRRINITTSPDGRPRELPSAIVVSI